MYGCGCANRERGEEIERDTKINIKIKWLWWWWLLVVVVVVVVGGGYCGWL